MPRAPRLLAVGGAHMDRRGRLAGPHRPATSNPGRMREEVGGGVFNAARAAALRGAAVSLMSMRGGDAAGERVADAIERAGFEDLSAVFLDRATPSYTAILDHEGELITGLADMELYELAFPKQMRRRKCREAAAAADAILCDANLPEAAIALLAASGGRGPLHAIAVSPAKAGRL
ncbi:PfkB family carbohydrate kinase, partial [Nitratireductor sp. ZSWI3]|uniref:PfkB family carbohydrate kinase n=1 Tax=Nitratireductor sp. ZSWI3 TaxID=2966359 RepID=UPI00214FAD65